MTPYHIPSDTVVFEQLIRNSRFICTIGQATSPDKARAEFASIRNAHPKANHVCWAYIAGAPDSFDRGMSDDKEPRGTAGKPMLSMLSYSGYGEIWATVARYFGGVKLGTGGLARAYGSSVKQALDLVKPRTREIVLPCRMTFDYLFLPRIEPILTEEKVTIVNRIYAENVSLDLLLPGTRCEQIRQRLTDVSSGSANFTIIPDE